MSTENSKLAAEIITTGTEILLGEIVDTNAAWIAQQLREAGINLYYKTTVGDNEQRVCDVLSLGLSRSDVLIVTGGLGPTADDITRQAIATVTDAPLYLDEGAVETLKAQFARFGAKMTENNVQQAYIPEGAIIIKNPVGTAPGFIVESEKGTVIALPGVPREMKRLMEDTVLPYLRERNGNVGIIRRRVLRTIGIGESTLDSEISDLMAGSNPTIGLAAHTGQADVRVTAQAESADAAEALIDKMEATIRERVGRYIYSTTAGEKFATVVARLLQEHDATVSLAETNTAGKLARQLNEAIEGFDPVRAQYVIGQGTLIPTLSEAIGEVGADRPTYNEQQAMDAAIALASHSDATFNFALLGTTGADEGVYGKKVGETWIALARAGEEAHASAERIALGGTDEFTQVRMVNQVLRKLWRLLDPVD